ADPARAPGAPRRAAPAAPRAQRRDASAYRRVWWAEQRNGRSGELPNSARTRYAAPMGIGHLAVGFAAKRWAPRLSLGVLLLAAVLPDVLWGILLLAGVEHARIVPGIAAIPLQLYDYPISHSLVTTAGWAAVFAMAVFTVTR